MKHLETAAAGTALVIALVGGVVSVETRFAKSAEVKRELSDLWARSLRLRLLELQLKPAPLSTADQALLEHLQRELNEATAR